MVGDTSNTVLRRKAVAAREVWQSRAMSPSKALKLAFARAADDVLELALAVTSVQVDDPSADDLVKGLSEDSLLILIDGPGGACGVLSVDIAIVAALTEKLTMGRVLQRAPDPRRPTRTDAAMIAPFIDRAFQVLAAILQGEDGGDRLSGYAFGVVMENPRMVELAIEATDFRRFRMGLDVEGLRNGEVQLAFPDLDADAMAAAAAAAQDAGAALSGEIAETPEEPTLRPAVLKARAQLDAVLHQLRMPLSKVLALKPGDVIEVPREALGETVLRAGAGQRVVEVRLGQINGHRAVRLRAEDGQEAAAMAGQGGAAQGPDAGGSAGPAKARGALSLDSPSAGAVADGPQGLDPLDAAPMPMAAMQDLPELDSLPPLDDLPPLGDLPDLGDLPGLGSMGDLPDLDGES